MGAIKNYVEEIWIDRFIESRVQEIESIEDYLLNEKFASSLLGVRFFQKEQRVIDGKNFIAYVLCAVFVLSREKIARRKFRARRIFFQSQHSSLPRVEKAFENCAGIFGEGRDKFFRAQSLRLARVSEKSFGRRRRARHD